MVTWFHLEQGYRGISHTTLETIQKFVKSITLEDLEKKCIKLGIEKISNNWTKEELKPYYEHYLGKGCKIREKTDDYLAYILFSCTGGDTHRDVSEFVVKTICLMVLEMAIIKEETIDFVSS